MREKNKDYERKIDELNKELNLEKCKACSINPTKIKRLISERDQLISDRALQIEKLIQKNIDYEIKITDLKKKIAHERDKKESNDTVKVDKLRSELDQLMSDRNEVEKLLSETDHNGKEDTIQVQSQIKSTKGLLIVLSILLFLILVVAFVIFF